MAYSSSGFPIMDKPHGNCVICLTTKVVTVEAEDDA